MDGMQLILAHHHEKRRDQLVFWKRNGLQYAQFSERRGHRYGFMESLMPSYVPKATAGNGLEDFDKF